MSQRTKGKPDGKMGGNDGPEATQFLLRGASDKLDPSSFIVKRSFPVLSTVPRWPGHHRENFNFGSRGWLVWSRQPSSDLLCLSAPFTLPLYESTFLAFILPFRHRFPRSWRFADHVPSIFLSSIHSDAFLRRLFSVTRLARSFHAPAALHFQRPVQIDCPNSRHR